MHCEWLSQLHARTIERRLRHADLIVGCSDYITDKVRERFPQHAARCVTIYNGVADARPATPAARGGKTVELLNVGRVSPEKGLHVLLEALEQVVAVHPEVRLTILGEESPVPSEFAVEISDDPVVRRPRAFLLGQLPDVLAGADVHSGRRTRVLRGSRLARARLCATSRRPTSSSTRRSSSRSPSRPSRRWRPASR